jgi:hypothetical protein
VSENKNFRPAVLKKTDLKVAEYSITGDDDVDIENGKTYYWRVQAIDDAGNESDWSATGVFTAAFSNVFPAWALYTLISIGAVIVIFLAFRIGRRTANRAGGQTYL